LKWLGRKKSEVVALDKQLVLSLFLKKPGGGGLKRIGIKRACPGMPRVKIDVKADR
jgi:hypothetical protein